MSKQQHENPTGDDALDQRTDGLDHGPNHGSGPAAPADSPEPARSAPSAGSAPSADSPADPDEGDAQRDADEQAEAEEEARQRAEEFAREHDPANHDIAAGADFRQPGDWTAEDGDGPQQLETVVPAHQSGSQDTASQSGEVRDGGHGWGSAAPMDDGSVAEGHPVKAWHDTMTYVLPDEPGYEAAPHECFVDAETAERAGFRHAH
ncbi:sunset domain-containing protein [Ornithinimicrobium panacihumi]|uniref:sunset domain-containing protein n=1 Tax=Ornithinimicrobium panacihumi TaxID=2008449 RepID=UPI003F88E5F6